ncbi:MAG: hypothetical protein V4649_08650 [Bacteroidota bacterium]
MDTTRLELIGKQLDQMISNIDHTNKISTGQIALIAAAIGASAAILAQLVIFLLTRFKERDNFKRELVAEERRLAYLLSELYKELVMHKVHKRYWYKTAEIYSRDKEEIKDSHERHFESNKKSFETLTKIQVTTSEYVKVVTHFTNLFGQNGVISKALNDIRTFQPRKASDFSGITTYEVLLKAQDKEESDLNIFYRYYTKCYDTINIEMISKI